MRNMGTRTSTLDIPFWLFAAPMLIGFAVAALGYISSRCGGRIRRSAAARGIF